MVNLLARQRSLSLVRCYVCEKEFDVDSCRLETTKRFFCCRECRIFWQKSDEYKKIHSNRNKKPDVEVICAYCGKRFLKRPWQVNKAGNNFCNNECRGEFNARKIKKEMTKEKILVHCYQCGKEKYVNEAKSKTNKYHFCSKGCYWNWRKENIPKGEESPFYNRVIKYCEICNKEIKVIPYVVERNNYFFCSQQCYWKWNMSESKVFNPETKPQVLINKLLESMNIKYNNEYFCDPYFIDNCLFVDNKLFFIECNGSFWHSDNRIFKIIKYQTQLNGIIRDRNKNNYIKDKYNVDILYLWEQDVLDNIELCKEIICEYIQNKGVLKNYHSFNYEFKDNKLNLKNKLIIPYMNWDVHMLETITQIKKTS